MIAYIASPLARIAGAALIAATLTAAAASGAVDATTSQVTATFRQMNVPIEGEFTGFRGAVDFDPGRPADGSARIEIDTASFDLGAPEYSDELRAKEWFDTKAHPTARFVSSSVTRSGRNQFVASGTLTLKGTSREINIPFSRRSEKGALFYEGEFPVSRKAYAIGSAEWDDTLEDTVIVKFRITTSAH